MPGFFFKRLKLDQLGKSRAFSKKALLFPENARLFRLKLRTQEPNLEFSSQATYAGGPVRQPYAYIGY
jgi:hypothetical protein